jgi:beta-glucosidase
VESDTPLETRLADLVARLTPDEKIGLLPTRQEAVPRLGLAEFGIGGEAAHGLVARDGPATVFPQTLGLSQTWDPELLVRVGEVVGTEARAYFHHREGASGLCLWAPTVDLLRDPRWGRTEEGWGEDPVLTGALASAYVRGMQGRDPGAPRVIATLKHFYANNHEADRTRSSSDLPEGLRDSYYLKAFELVLRHGAAGSIMTAYNAVDGVPAMLRPEINEVVRGRWGWDGFVVCDGGALGLLVSDHRAFPTWAEALAASLKAGIDCFPEPADQLKPAAREALVRGLITVADLNRAVTRTLRARFRLEQHNRTAGPTPPPQTLVRRPESRALAREAATKATVLLTNRGVLPLSLGETATLAVVGPLADVAYRDWYTGRAEAPVTPLAGLVARLGDRRVAYADGLDLVALGVRDRWAGVAAWDDPGLVADRTSIQGTELFRRTDWGWGAQTFQALANGRFLTEAEGPIEASAAEVGGWFVRQKFSAPREGRGTLTAWDGQPVGVDSRGRLAVGQPETLEVRRVKSGLDEAVRAATGAGAAVVFVGNHPMVNGRETEDRPSLALPPDQEDLIRAVAPTCPRTVVVIVGSYPYSLGDWKDGVGAILYCPHPGQEAGHAWADLLFGDAEPGGRLSMTWYAPGTDLGPITDYDIAARGRTHLYYPGTPQFSFGHGLGYTRYAYRNLVWDPATESASVEVTNTGPRAGTEVVQFYHGRALAAFARVTLAPGESQQVTCPLPRAARRSPLPFAVGSSSTDLHLTLPGMP